MQSHRRKMTAPILVTVLTVLYYAAYFSFLLSILDGVWKYVLGLLPLIFTAVTVGVCVQRIREIKKGEEDDLSQY